MDPLPPSAPPAPRLGLYVHVPFCARRCEFCAFYERAPLKADIDDYMDAVVRELSTLAPTLPRAAETVFWGGGTPGILLPRDMERLGLATLAACRERPAEWTVEMTPATMRPERLKMLKALGVNRLSMGVQSFDERILAALGRVHTVKQVYEAIDAARAAGFDNLNLDMMFALPGQSYAEWEADLRQAIAAGPEHISTYCLTFEEDTPLWLRLQRGQATKRGEDEEAQFYLRTWAVLGEAGLGQYEVSNFARAGRECVHNLNTWRMQEWAGAGPSASSQIGMRRFTNARSLERWRAGIERGEPDLVDVVDLDAEMLAVDSLVFGLRMTAGVDLAALQRRFPAYRWGALRAFAAELEDNGLAEAADSMLRLTPQGRLVADEVGARIMDV